MILESKSKMCIYMLKEIDLLKKLFDDLLIYCVPVNWF